MPTFTINRSQNRFLKNRTSTPTTTATSASTYRTKAACLPILPIVGTRVAGRNCMDWKRRLRELIVAGGALGLGACTPSTVAQDGGGPPGIPCGNANPDPCICGRPEADPDAAIACDQEKACQASGGTWIIYLNPPHCER